MKYIYIVLFLSVSLFSKNIEVKVQKDLSKEHLKLIHKNKLSKKELAYQKYKKELEEENQKLEDDGFCSCNNN